MPIAHREAREMLAVGLGRFEPDVAPPPAPPVPPVALATASDDSSGTTSTLAPPVPQPMTPATSAATLIGEPITSAPSAPPPVAEAASVARTLPGESPFAPWLVRPLGGRDVLDALPAPQAASQVRQALELVVQAEGPIHLDRLARQVAAAFDLTRLSPARTESILSHLPARYRRDAAEPFAWPAEIDPATWTGFRAPESSPRRVDQVSLHEIGNAMAALCHASAGMYREEIRRETLAVFGGKRLTPGITARLDEALSFAVSHHLVSAAENGLIRSAAEAGTNAGG